MGEVQEQRHICKICKKVCVSGKSLGGHMRVHLSLISASRKAASAKAGIGMEFEGGHNDQENSSQNPSNISFRKKAENCKREFNFGDNDDELRERSKKSLRISDSRNGVSGKAVSCKECGKEFPTVRALSGHMRCHSIKNNKETHCCKKCGKGFDSMRAMFGHMKSHSKKSEMESLCPIRRKRSRIMYENPSSMDSGDEMVEVEAAAASLMMLSMGVRDWDRFTPVSEFSDDDDSVYFGAESSRKGKGIGAMDDSCVSGPENSKMYRNSNCLTENSEISVDFEYLDNCMVRVENDMRNDFEVFNDLKEPEHLKKCSIKLAYSGDRKHSEFLMSNSWKEVNVPIHESSSEKCYSDDFFDDDHETLKDFMMKNKETIVHSPQGIEGHNAGYKIQENRSLSDINASRFSVLETVSQLEQEIIDVGIVRLETVKNKGRECPVCFKVFSSGQALGGHKRAHYTGTKTEETIVMNQEIAKVHKFLDLNVPVNVDDGMSLWRLPRGHDHEGLFLSS